MEVKRQDIDRVALTMGKDFSDAERSDVLQCMDCCDVNACPGSGKTTTMVAKLMILSEKLAGTMIGICTLSHTNAAKNEIEKSLGTHAGTIIRYPHFVGTIQVFTDLFLAIPAYIEEFGHRPVAIDNELYENVAKRNYSQIKASVRYALEQHTNNAGLGLVSKTSYGFTNFELVGFNGDREAAFYCSTKTATYQEILRWKKEITSLGYLTYHDAFSYANRYLEKYPNLAGIISKRFSYVFIDEMQDTDVYQNELIERIFRGNSIIQRFGDPNQTIYEQSSLAGESIWRPEGNLSIRTSRRLSIGISRISQGITIHPHEIIGNDQIPNHPSSIILFSERRRRDVIPRFGQIIEGLSLHDGPFKVLGAVGNPNQNPIQLSLTSYWPSFQKRLQQNKTNNPFWGLIRQAKSSIHLVNNYSEAYQLFSRAYSELFRIQQVRGPNGHPYNASQLIKQIRESGIENLNRYKEIIFTNCENLISAGDLDIGIMLSQVQMIFSFLGILVGRQTEAIIQGRDEQIQPGQPPIIGDPNIYLHAPNIPIEVNTIHSAKGQTHQATLLVETFYFRDDLSTILPYLIGQNIRTPGSRISTHYLPLTYVACTRPSHLLCLAIQKNHLDDRQIGSLREFGWLIDELN